MANVQDNGWLLQLSATFQGPNRFHAILATRDETVVENAGEV